MGTRELTASSFGQLLHRVAALAQTDDRPAAIRRLADYLKLDAVLFFSRDVEIGKLLVAPGFPQTLPDGAAWEYFLENCVNAGRLQTELPFPRQGTMTRALGLAYERSSVLVLMGEIPADDTLDRIEMTLPLLSAALRWEQTAALCGSQLTLAHQVADESKMLAAGLDNARRAAQQEIVSRKKAEEALRLARDELSRTNGELEIRVRERTQRHLETIAELEAFSYSVSHDMRAPLRAMQAYASVLLEDLGPKLEAVERGYLDRISRAAQKLDRLIQDVLVHSRVAHGEIALESVDLESVLADVVQNYPQLQEPAAEVSVESALPSVLGHEVLVGQCVSNLMTNAVKFVAPGTKPRVRLWSESRDGTVTLWIADNGIGVAPHNQLRIFRMFQRLNQDVDYEGTGIGLPITKKAITRMGGEVGLFSEEGKGSRFWLTFRAPPAQSATR